MTKKKKVETSAMHFKQNGSVMTLTKMTANQLLNYTEADRYNSDLDYQDPDQGYQRPVGHARVKKLGNFLHRNIEDYKSGNSEDFFQMPTAILLSDRGVNAEYKENSVSFPIDSKFKTVDGMHRIEGIRHAVEVKGNEDLGEYEFSVIILRDLDKNQEMNQFRVVNGEAKSVNTALVNIMLVRIQIMQGEDYIEEKLKWKVIAQKTLESLNTKENGVWFDKIIMPDKSKYSAQEINDEPEKKHRRITFATSFITSLKPVIDRLEAAGIWNDRMPIDSKVESLIEILDAFWSTLHLNMKPAFDEASDYVLQKTPGVFSMHWLLCELITRNYQARLSLESVDSYDRHIGGGRVESMLANYWKIGTDELNATAYGSMKGFKELYQSILDEIDESL